MSAAEYISVTWKTMSCGICGISFQVPSEFHRTRREAGSDWYCPNGHCRVFRTSDVDDLKKRLEAERGRTRFAQRQLKNEQSSHRATKGHLTRQKNRAAAGVCPCCTRTFEQLARHMKTQHPGYSK